MQAPTPEAKARIAVATAEVHEILAALNSLAARVERFRASGLVHRRIPDRDLPQDIPLCKPGDSFSMPGDLGGEYFETDPEAHFWGELPLPETREALAGAAASLARDLGDADPYNAVKRAEELLARLPASMLDALRARLAELQKA
ncbi:MAG TPA: hypothetical protein VF121_16635 [Thermoanaerobaculia bacterium]|nr:hypothetical protein [Thermoanaerobaculia bacterium]